MAVCLHVEISCFGILLVPVVIMYELVIKNNKQSERVSEEMKFSKECVPCWVKSFPQLTKSSSEITKFVIKYLLQAHVGCYGHIA